MAKAPPKIEPTPEPKLPLPEHRVCLAHPEEMPAVLNTVTADGWQLITIVHCRHTNEHAAYFRRPALTPATP